MGCFTTKILLVVVALLLFGTGSEEFGKVRKFLSQNCEHCHSGAEPEGNFSISDLSKQLSDDSAARKRNAALVESLEKALRRIDSGQMPPPDEDPDPEELGEASSNIQAILNAHHQRYPFIPKLNSVRRLTRTEYRNVIRDLLRINMNVEELLPKDESSHGFDNITVDELSPTLINRYLSAADKIARLAIGGSDQLAGKTVRVPQIAARKSTSKDCRLARVGAWFLIMLSHELAITKSK